jgi:hypothetical protein
LPTGLLFLRGFRWLAGNYFQSTDHQPVEANLMRRRNFLTTSMTAFSLLGLQKSFTSAATFSPGETLSSDAPKPEYYELRLYHLRRGPKVKLIHDFFRDVALPAMNRNGITPVGFFDVMIGPDNPTVYMLIPHKSLDTFATASARLAADAEYQKSGASFLNLPATDPAYIRVESSLMVAFDSIPKLEVPQNKPRIFELRTYESHSKKANKKKIEMFNTGEIAIFRRAGLQPVFFGETLIGAKLPNLTYMLTYPDMATHDKNWATFAADPEWKKLSTTPGYTDAEIVTNINSVFLRPTAYSQI